MGFRSGERVHTEEILDAGTASPDEVKRSLADLRRVNTLLGGRRVLRLLMREQLRRTDLTRCSVLDTGTGSGDLAECAAREFGAMVVGLDRVALHLRGGGAGVNGSRTAFPAQWDPKLGIHVT